MRGSSIRKITVFIVAILFVLLSYVLWSGMKSFSETRIIFFDVGQGDAIFISQGSNQVLIDGGRSGQVILERLGQYMPMWDRTLEMVVATHPDEDHIGGLIDVMKHYHVGTLVKTNVENKTGAYFALVEYARKSDVLVVDAYSGLKVRFSDGSELFTMHPFTTLPQADVKDTNATSIVMKLTVKEESFLFTGDLPSTEEIKMNIGHIDVLKVGHHGSKSSSSDEFLKNLTSKQAIISVGKENRYGHPAPDVLNRLRNNHIEIFRTDELGSIVYHCLNEGNQKCFMTFDR